MKCQLSGIPTFRLITCSETDVAVAVRAALSCSLRALLLREADSLADAASLEDMCRADGGRSSLIRISSNSAIFSRCCCTASSNRLCDRNKMSVAASLNASAIYSIGE